MPTDYAPRTATQRKVVSGKQSFSPRSFGGGALFGALLVLALIYAPTLSGNRAGDDAGEDSAAPPPMPALTYEFMDRLPKEQVVTNVTPYEPPPRTDEPEREVAPATLPSTGKDAPPSTAQGDAGAFNPKSESPAAAPADEAGMSPQTDASRRPDVPQRRGNAQPPRERARLAGSEDMEYMLQAASLRSREDAEAMRARLILDGLSAPVLVVRHPDGGARHRVLVGPFAEEGPMRRIQETLRAKDIAALAMRRPR